MPDSIAIVGAGIGGLSLAVCLLRRGYSNVHVYERGAALSSRGGTIRLDANAQDALSELGVHREVEATAIRNKRFDTLSNGKLLHQTVYTLENREHLISISREALQRILADAAGAGVVHLDHAVVDIDESDTGVELVFGDRTRRRFDMVVGADGVFSTVGDRLFPKSSAPEFSGLVVYYCIAKGEHLPEAVHTEHFISQGGLGFRQVTVAGGGSDGRWDSLQITTRGPPCSSEWSAEGSVEDMRGYLDLAGDDCLPGARRILENADRVFKWGMFQSPASASWISATGRVVLLGDAAHAMAPFTGQGAGSAIQDGLCLGTLLVERLAEGLAEGGATVSALRKYQQIRKPVCETAIQRAYSRGMHITAHGLTRRFVDAMTRRIGRTGSRRGRRRLAVTLRVGARVTERVDGALDRARSFKAT